MTIEQITIPDLGGAVDVDVIEILVNPGDTVEKDDSLVTLEGDKASMDVPAPFAGKIETIQIAVGNKANQGDLMLTMKVGAGELTASEQQTGVKSGVEKVVEKPIVLEAKKTASAVISTATAKKISEVPVEESLNINTNIHAGPAVRRIAREFGVELSQVTPSGRKGRLLKEDVQQYVKAILSGEQVAGASKSVSGISVAAAPQIDFSKFGEVETQPLSKIKRLTGINTHRSWVTVPHVTQFDEADITEMEAFRQANKTKAEKLGFKLTPLVFLMKAVVRCLKELPYFNASLDATGEKLILKKYFHLGVAVDTPNGLVVPVIRDVDQKGLYDLAKELGEISKKAREKGLTINEMSGSCFTISSLGGIGGTAFTPIVNAPDVAILGVSKSQMKPIFQNGEFVPRLLLPLSLSYDHRVIDGAAAARFTRLLNSFLSDIRTLLL